MLNRTKQILIEILGQLMIEYHENLFISFLRNTLLLMLICLSVGLLATLLKFFFINGFCSSFQQLFPASLPSYPENVIKIR